MFDHPLVQPLKTAADHGYSLRASQMARHALIEPATARRQVDQGPCTARAVHSGLDRVTHHIGAQHHAGPTARRRVIDVAMLALTELTQVQRFQLP